MSSDNSEGNFFRAVLELHNKNWKDAQRYIDTSRSLIDTELSALVGESYSRAYQIVVSVQTLSEMEEVIDYSNGDNGRKKMIKKLWKKRLKGAQRNIEVWKNILVVRSLAISPTEDAKSWIDFANLCKKEGKSSLAMQSLKKVTGTDKITEELIKNQPGAAFAQIRLDWSCSKSEEQKRASYKQLVELLLHLEKNKGAKTKGGKEDDRKYFHLLASCHLKLSKWRIDLAPGFRDFKNEINEKDIQNSLSHCKKSLEYRNDWYKSWHSWALLNFEVVSYFEIKKMPS
jgi:FKBP12-rapamycin complex-associated protein